MFNCSAKQTSLGSGAGKTSESPWNDQNVFSSHHELVLKVIWVLIMTNISSLRWVSVCFSSVCVCVFVPLYSADVPSWIEHKERSSRLNVGQQKVASEGKRTKVGFPPPPVCVCVCVCVCWPRIAGREAPREPLWCGPQFLKHNNLH